MNTSHHVDSRYARASDAARTHLRIALLANRRVIGESIAFSIPSSVGTAAVGSTDPLQAHRLPRRPAAVIVVGSRTDGSTSAAVSMARRRWRDAVIVALADTDRFEDGLALVAQGADTWLTRNCDLEDLRGLLERIAVGDRQLLPEEALPFIAAAVREPEKQLRRTSRLTSRELQVLVCFTNRISRRDVAAMLGISLGTVRTHVKNILGKLDVHTIQLAAAVAVEDGLGSQSTDDGDGHDEPRSATYAHRT